VATITGNTVHSNVAGIVAQYSTGITIDGNNADSNSQDGIIVSNAPGTVVRGNSALTAGSIGISIQFSNDNIIIENTVSGNTAIHVWGSTGNTLIKNNIESCSDCNISYSIGVVGITLTEAHRNTFSQNDIDSTHLWGIFLIDSNENTFSGNVISNHQKEIASNASGLLLRNSHDNTFKYNTISNNERPYTIWDSANNKIYNNNFISNFNEGLLYDNVDPTGVIYSAESTVFNLDLPIGGNYWDNFDEISEGCEDLNNDSFCDSPFIDPTDIIRYSENSPEYYGIQDNFAWSIPDGWLVNSPIIPDLDSIIIPEVVHCSNSDPTPEPETPTCTEPEVLDAETNMCVTPEPEPVPEPETPTCTEPEVLDAETNMCVTPEPEPVPEPEIPPVDYTLICHIPPGNPENPQTIMISTNAYPAHLAHGDYEGACTESTLEIQEFTVPTDNEALNEALEILKNLRENLDSDSNAGQSISKAAKLHKLFAHEDKMTKKLFQSAFTQFNKDVKAFYGETQEVSEKILLNELDKTAIKIQIQVSKAEKADQVKNKIQSAIQFVNAQEELQKIKNQIGIEKLKFEEGNETLEALKLHELHLLKQTLFFTAKIDGEKISQELLKSIKNGAEEEVEENHKKNDGNNNSNGNGNGNGNSGNGNSDGKGNSGNSGKGSDNSGKGNSGNSGKGNSGKGKGK